MPLNSIKQVIAHLVIIPVGFQNGHLLLQFGLVLVMGLNRLNIITIHVWLQQESHNHPRYCHQLLCCVSLGIEVTEAYRCKRLECPIITGKILVERLCIDQAVGTNPGRFREMAHFSLDEPDTSNPMSTGKVKGKDAQEAFYCWGQCVKLTQTTIPGVALSQILENPE